MQIIGCPETNGLCSWCCLLVPSHQFSTWSVPNLFTWPVWQSQLTTIKILRQMQAAASLKTFVDTWTDWNWFEPLHKERSAGGLGFPFMRQVFFYCRTFLLKLPNKLFQSMGQLAQEATTSRGSAETFEPLNEIHPNVQNRFRSAFLPGISQNCVSPGLQAREFVASFFQTVTSWDNPRSILPMFLCN